MAEHIWSVMCAKAIVDSQSNNISLFDVLEQVTLSGPGPSEYKEGSEVLLSFGYSLASLWARSDLSVPEKIRVRIRLLTPNKEIDLEEQEIDLIKNRRCRSIVTFQNFPMRGPGIYIYKIDMNESKAKKKMWRNVANIPVEVIFDLSKSKT